MCIVWNRAGSSGILLYRLVLIMVMVVPIATAMGMAMGMVCQRMENFRRPMPRLGDGGEGCSKVLRHYVTNGGLVW